jgi:hypothetical protein
VSNQVPRSEAAVVEPVTLINAFYCAASRGGAILATLEG